MNDNIDISRPKKPFGNPVKLGIMAALMATESIGFTDLKESLGASDGNLASHLYSLEELGYVVISKQFVGKKPNTRVSATDAGKAAFREHLDVLEAILRSRQT